MNLDPAPNDSCIRLFRSGSWFDLLNPTPAMVHVEDIAFGLSNVTRFAGQVRGYSVAQHSVLCSRAAPSGLRFRMLMHDAAEAYVHDISRPCKRLLIGYLELEHRVLDAIHDAYGIERGPMSPVEKEVDNRMLRTEARDLLFGGQEPPAGYPEVPCYMFWIKPWSAEQAEHEFLSEFGRLVRR